jgi:DNA polymerase-3 subunit beta
MRFIKANREAILRSLLTVTGIVEKRHTMPILANVLISKDAERISFLASDAEIQIRTTGELGDGPDAAATTVSAYKIRDILKALPENTEVSIKLDERKASIQAGRSRFSLQTLSDADFPTLAAVEHWPVTLSMSQAVLKQLFQMVSYAMAVQDVRYYLNGLLMVTEGDLVRVVATDGHRLACCETRIEGATMPRQEVIIPRKSVMELQRLLGDGNEPVSLDIAERQMRLRFDQIEFVSKLVDGKFPDYQRVIPTTHRNRLHVDREQFAAALARASILTSEKLRGVRMTLDPSGLRIQANNADQEEASEEVETDYQGDQLELGFNITYLQDVLAHLKHERIRMEFGSANSSALISVPDNDSFKYVVMPMRI